MRTKGIYEDRSGLGKLKKISEWKQGFDHYYKADFADESGKTMMFSEKEVRAIKPDKSVYLKSEDIIGITLTFEHPIGFTDRQVIETLQDILPENCFDKEVKKEFGLYVYSYSGHCFKAGELSERNQEKASEINPSFFIHEMDVELYLTVSINTHLGESVIYFSNYKIVPILSSYENELLCIDPEDPFFQKVYGRYFHKLKKLGWKPSGPLGEIQAEQESSNSLIQEAEEPAAVPNEANIVIEEAGSHVKEANVLISDWKTTSGDNGASISYKVIELDLEEEMLLYFRKLTVKQKKAILNLMKEI